MEEYAAILATNRWSGTNEQPDAKAVLDLAVNGAGERSGTRWKHAVSSTVEFCFGTLGPRAARASEKPQGFASDLYWQRFLSRPELFDRDRDQPVLAALASKDLPAVLLLLEDEHASAAVERHTVLSEIAKPDHRHGRLDPLPAGGTTHGDAWDPA